MVGMSAPTRRPTFSSPFFSSLRFYPSPSRPRRKTSPPLTVPSKDYSRGGGLAARLNREGRRTEYAQQIRKKKTMKKNTKQIEGTREQIRTTDQQTPTAAAPAAAAAPAPAAAPTPHTDTRLPIDTDARKANRSLTTDQLLTRLQAADRRLWEMAEVVGKWVWVSFSEQPAASVRQTLAQLGFHWNRDRQCWQHPCGQFRLASSGDPRERYQSYAPADLVTR